MNRDSSLVVYTTGVFDLFHIGHLNVLKKAAELGPTLIVGVSTDELVRAYKGRSPVVPFMERAAIVEALRYVSQVVPQISLDKAEAWETLGFDCWVVGNDHEGDPKYQGYAADLEERNVRTVFLDYTEGVSTSLRRTLIQSDH